MTHYYAGDPLPSHYYDPCNPYKYVPIPWSEPWVSPPYPYHHPTYFNFPDNSEEIKRLEKMIKELQEEVKKLKILKKTQKRKNIVH